VSPMKNIFSAIFLSLVFIISFLPISYAEGETAKPFRELQAQLGSLVSKHPYKNTAISIVDVATGETVYSHREAVALKPASILKILTSLAVLDRLGADYRFETFALAGGLNEGKVQNLYIKGGGDPSFTTESMWVMARAIKRRGVSQIGDIVLDEGVLGAGGASAIAAGGTLSESGGQGTVLPASARRSGQRAYEAGASALALNFNSIAFEVCPGQAGQPALITPDPWEVDIKVTGAIATRAGGSSTFQLDEVSSGASGISYRAGGHIAPNRPCAVVYRSIKDPAAYFGQTLAAFLKHVGVEVKGSIRKGLTPENAVQLYRHESKPFSFILHDLNNYSSNFIAQQLLLALGSFSYEMGILSLENYLNRFGLNESKFHIEDASGLSHSNRLSAHAVTRLLYEGQKYEELRAEFENSLSVPGRNGTLKSRRISVPGATLRAKTGTLTGVSSLAGYASNRIGRKFAFTIIQNDAGSKDVAVRFEDSIVKILLGSGI